MQFRTHSDNWFDSAPLMLSFFRNFAGLHWDLRISIAAVAENKAAPEARQKGSQGVSPG
jgi:hypothetical protein